MQLLPVVASVLIAVLVVVEVSAEQKYRAASNENIISMQDTNNTKRKTYARNHFLQFFHCHPVVHLLAVPSLSLRNSDLEAENVVRAQDTKFISNNIYIKYSRVYFETFFTTVCLR